MSWEIEFEAWKEQGKPTCKLCRRACLYGRFHVCLDNQLVKLPTPEWLEQIL